MLSSSDEEKEENSQQQQSSTTSKRKFYFSHLIAPSVFDYLFQSIETTTSSTINENAGDEVAGSGGGGGGGGSSSKRKSIFFPLLVDQSLVSGADPMTSGGSHGGADNVEAVYNKNFIKRISEILGVLDERSLLVSKYLTNSLRYYSKFIKVGDRFF